MMKCNHEREQLHCGMKIKKPGNYNPGIRSCYNQSFFLWIFFSGALLFRHEKVKFDKINAIEIIMKEHLEKDFIVSNKKS